MDKNVKIMIFILTLVTLLATVGAVCAADDNNSTTATDTSVDDVTIVGDTVSDTMITETVQAVSNDSKVDTNTIEKEYKNNIKTATKTVNVNNYTELTKAVNNVVYDNENNEYIISLNEGNYTLLSSNDGRWNKQASSDKNVIINANGQTLNTTRYELNINNNYNITINYAKLKHNIWVYSTATFNSTTLLNPIYVIGTLNLNNCIINTSIETRGTLYIDANTVFGTNTFLDGYGQVISEDQNKLLPYLYLYSGNNTIKNTTLNKQKVNEGNLLLENCTLNCTFTNNANLTISDDCIFTENFQLQGNGNININDINKVIPYMSTLTGNLTLENMVIDKYKTNAGNLTLINCTVKSNINNNGNLTIDDDTVFEGNVGISGNGSVYMNNSNRIYNSTTTYYGVHTFNNLTINKYIYNYGNLTINSSVVNTQLSNNNPQGSNITFINTRLNAPLTNDGLAKIIISDDTTFGPNFQYTGNNNIEIDDMNRILPYFSLYSGNVTLENMTINTYKENSGNLTLKNCTLNASIYNRGSEANLIIDDDIIVGENARIINGNLFTNKLDELIIYCQNVEIYGNNTVNNKTIEKRLINHGNLTFNNTTIDASWNILENDGTLNIFNSTIKSSLVNEGTLTIDECNINKSISNNGILIIGDNVEFGENFQLYGNGEIIINDKSCLIPYLSTFNGNFTIENTTVNTTKTNNGNLELINCTIENTIYNYGNITTNNVTFNSTIENNGNLTISDDSIFGEKFIIKGNGNIIINDSSRLLPYLSSFENVTLENILFNHQISFKGNNTLINSTFENANINNEGNLTVINSTFKNSKGCLINNQGHLDLINVVIENNTYTGDIVEGFILNSNTNKIATMSIDNLTFANNVVNASGSSGNNHIRGFINCMNNNINTLKNSLFINNTAYKYIHDSSNEDNYDHNAIIIYSTSNTSISNCIFENNTATAIDGTDNINLTDCIFKNNKRIINARSGFSAPAIASIGNMGNVNNCKFIDNFLNLTNSQSYGLNTSSALRALNSVISNSIFEGNGIECNSAWLTINSAGISGINLTVKDNNFTNNYINTVKGTSGSSETYEFDYGSSGFGVDLCVKGTSTITGNNFINSTGNQDVGSIYSDEQDLRIEITNNTFINCKANKETIAVVTYDKNIADNTFINCSIEFKSLNLTAPNKIYTNDNITVSLDIELAYPDNYDSDILEKTDYNWYINGETTTDKETSKTISVGTENIIIYVTPTVSNNRTRVLAIAPTILNDIIITPDNINNYVFEGELIASHNSRLIFQGEFNNIGEIYNNKNEVLFDGSQATFTNTSFIIEANDNTIQNMNINNTDTNKYIITNIGNNNIIQNNTLTQSNNQGKTAAIYSLNSNNTIIQYNNINSKGPSVAIQYGETSAIANTQAILDESGTNNQIIHNTIYVANTTDAELDAFGTIEAITAPKGTNNTISYNTIHATGARFNYGINTLEYVTENKITYNNITVTGYRYTDGIQLGNGATGNIIANNKCECYRRGYQFVRKLQTDE